MENKATTKNIYPDTVGIPQFCTLHFDFCILNREAPIMSTQPQIVANRLNAQKSTGPQTPQGKAVVSQNALKHGLSARPDVIITENQADFDLHRDAPLTELAPI